MLLFIREAAVIIPLSRPWGREFRNDMQISFRESCERREFSTVEFFSFFIPINYELA